MGTIAATNTLTFQERYSLFEQINPHQNEIDSVWSARRTTRTSISTGRLARSPSPTAAPDLRGGEHVNQMYDHAHKAPMSVKHAADVFSKRFAAAAADVVPQGVPVRCLRAVIPDDAFGERPLCRVAPFRRVRVV